MRVCVIIPAYNEEETIARVVAETRRYVGDVYVVDDGSKDGTQEIARKAGALVVRHPVNRGQGAALRTGYRLASRAGFTHIIQVDADEQHDPSYIPALMESAEGADIVVGSRFLSKRRVDYPITRKMGIRLFTFVVGMLSGAKVTDVISGFRLIRLEALLKLTEPQDRHPALEQVLEAARKGIVIREIPVGMPQRRAGTSKFNPKTFILFPFRMAEVIVRVMLFRR